jgi:ABC-type nickel/cobalt efflux system permease component RcnA
VKRVAAAVAAVVIFLLTIQASPAAAHPLGNFTINHYLGVVVGVDAVVIDYIVDLAEIPTFQERDLDEADSSDRCDELAAGLEVTSDSAALELVSTASSIEFLPGQGGLETTRIECGYRASVTLSAGTTISIADTNHGARVGWHEMTASGDGVTIRSDLPVESTSQRLTAYPEDSRRPDQRTGTVTVTAVGATSGSAAAQPASSGSSEGELRRGSTAGRLDVDDDGLLALIADGGEGPLALLVALGFAAGLGAVHGLAPGHGKTVIAAYLVATKGTRRQALWLALAVALSHTLGVFVLGGVTVAASSQFAPERVYPWLKVVSGTIVLCLGAWLVAHAVRNWRHRRALARHEAAHHTHDHGHEHHHSHDDHEHHHEPAAGAGWHRHGLLPHHHGRALDRLVPSDQPLGWKALTALGFSGGLVPSTSAVVLLLGAIQLERLLLGGVLVLAFGVGMSVALVAAGVGIVTVSRRAGNRLDTAAVSRHLTRWLQPVASAAIVSVGLYLTTRALLEVA